MKKMNEKLFVRQFNRFYKLFMKSINKSKNIVLCNFTPIIYPLIINKPGVEVIYDIFWNDTNYCIKFVLTKSKKRMIDINSSDIQTITITNTTPIKAALLLSDRINSEYHYWKKNNQPEAV